MIPPDSLKCKLLDEVIDGIPPEGCETLDRGYNDDEWNDYEKENTDESEDEDSNSSLVPESDVPSVACTPEKESAHLECLSRIESVITAEKKRNHFQSSSVFC